MANTATITTISTTDTTETDRQRAQAAHDEAARAYVERNFPALDKK